MFDFIIVGAGSAGCVLANRLSADPTVRVLLLEAGDEDSGIPEIQMPAAWPALRGSSVDWNFATEPDSMAGTRTIAWPRGRVLGGSSATNAMIYIRGDRSDYDLWSEMGNAGWAYDEVLPFFLKSELNVADGRWVTPLAYAFLDACERSGIEHVPDFNDSSPMGASLFQFTQKGGRRWSAAQAYLAPIRSRSNLTVEVKAHATRIRFEGRRAVAVDYECDGIPKSALASQEIILSAGAIGSPHLLLRSGVGPAHELEAVGITSVVDLPGVGKNLQDHAMLFVSYSCTSPVSMFGAVTPENIEAFVGAGSGPLTCNGVEAGAFLKTDRRSRVADLQIHFVAYCFSGPGVVADRHGFAIAPTLLHPKSRGEIVLRSADLFAPPVIRPRYLTEQADLDVLVDGISIARQLATSGAFDSFGSIEVLPGRDVQDRADVERWIRENVDTCFHPTGTCKMGSDSEAVVNPALRVRGGGGPSSCRCFDYA